MQAETETEVGVEYSSSGHWTDTVGQVDRKTWGERPASEPASRESQRSAPMEIRSGYLESGPPKGLARPSGGHLQRSFFPFQPRKKAKWRNFYSVAKFPPGVIWAGQTEGQTRQTTANLAQKRGGEKSRTETGALNPFPLHSLTGYCAREGLFLASFENHRFPHFYGIRLFVLHH